MNKKVFVILIIGLMLGFGCLYLIDMHCMNNNKPVIFSTWGYDYAPPVENSENNGIEIPEKESKEKENEEIEVERKEVEEKEIEENEITYDKNGKNLSFLLPSDWEYEIDSEENDRYYYSIKLYPANSENYAVLRSHKDFFGVCGTGLECKDITLDNGINATVGYYDNNENWSFITFEYEDEIVANNYGLEKLEAEKAIEILKTLKSI